MGLDVYLYWEKDRAEIDRLQDLDEEITTACWKKVENGRKYEELSKQEKDYARDLTKQERLKHGLQEDGDIPEELQKRIELASNLYPKHYWKIGYFRSSYNDGGINHILSNAKLPTLDEVFEIGNAYHNKPDWNKSKERAIDLREKYIKFKEESCGYITVRLSAPLTKFKEEDVLSDFLEHKNEHKGFKNYSSRNGDFFLGGIKIYAVYRGKQGCFGEETYLVIRNEEKEDFYLQAIDIMIETIDWVLAQEDKDNYVLHWSG